MSLLSNAKPLEAQKSVTKGASKKKEVELAGLYQYAEVCTALTTLESLKATLKSEVEVQAFEEFMLEAAETGRRPESYRGVEGEASASVELRKRSTASALNEAEVKLLEENNLKPTKVVATPELFAINPAYATDMQLLEKVEKALKKIVPADFFVKQQETSKLVVGDDVIEQAFKNKSPREVIQAVTCFAMKPTLKDVALEDIFADVQNMLSDEPVLTSSKQAA